MEDALIGQPAHQVGPRSLGRKPNEAAPGTQGAPKEAWTLQYTDANGFVQNITLGAKGSITVSTGASSVPVQFAVGSDGTFLSADSSQSSGLLWSAITGGAMLPGIPPRFTAPADVTISGSVSLTERVNYFKTLTVNNGVTLTGVAGGTIIICESALVNAGTISVNTLGAKGGATTAAGRGGGAYGRGLIPSTMTRTQGAFASDGVMSATNPVQLATFIQNYMATGGASTTGVGAAGGAWPFTTGSPFDEGSHAPADLALMYWLWQLVLQCNEDHATDGGIGGGGGGGGANTTATAGIAAGLFGAAGASGGTSGSGGGSGMGAGGAGGAGAAGGNNGGAGGRGGGVLLIFCKTLNNTGTISANGDNGVAASGNNSGGGGGGGGGAVIVTYETLTAAGTIQANGGNGGAGAGTGSAGGAGGAGSASSFKTRSGV